MTKLLIFSQNNLNFFWNFSENWKNIQAKAFDELCWKMIAIIEDSDNKYCNKLPIIITMLYMYVTAKNSTGAEKSKAVFQYQFLGLLYFTHFNVSGY